MCLDHHHLSNVQLIDRRTLERGHSIRAVEVESSAVSVDTLYDLNDVRRLMASDHPVFEQYRDGPVGG